jgi:hypothetical protein
MIKKILFGLLLLFLFLPILQQAFHLFKTKELSGEFTKAHSEPFSMKAWMDGSYQKTNEKYLNENFGFRSTCVRINNQLAFNLYQEARAINVIIGKQNYLYGDGYVNAYYGNDFIGQEKVAETVRKLKFVRDTLRKKNIDLMVMIVPGKALFFPEFLPDEPHYEKKITNYESYKQQLEKTNIPFLDMCSYLLKLKKTSPYPLYPKTGIHWSLYGAEIAVDSLARFVGKLRDTVLPKVTIPRVRLNKNPEGSDDDVEKGMNLFFQIPKFIMAYPLVDIDFKNTYTPHALIIGDSYVWNIYGSGRAAQIFNHPHFWYYYKDLYKVGMEGTLRNENVDLKKEIEEQEVIILLANDARLVDFSEGFIDDAYDLYANGGKGMQEKKEARAKEIAKRMADIKGDKEWFANLKKEADEKHVPVDSLVKVNAVYTYDMDHQKR